MYKYLFLFMASAVLFACKKEKTNALPSQPPVQEPGLLLKDITIPNLPSPYYHFEYGADGKPVVIGFSNGFFTYNIRYEAGKVKEMTNIGVGNSDRLEYLYDNAGKVT